MKANINGTEIYYDIAGMKLRPHKNGFIEVPTLFLLHGGPGGDHLRYKIHSLGLEKKAQLVFIDHRGCGRSKKTTAKEYTLQNNIKDVEALRKHLGLDKIALLGTSYGGIVALGYAIKYQKHLSQLILVASSPSHRFLASAKAYLARVGSQKQITSAQKLWEGKFKNSQEVKKFFNTMESLYSYKKRKPKQMAYGKSGTIWSHVALNQGFKNFLRTYNFVPKLNKIKVPTLILAGKEDWICRPEEAQLMAKKIPHAQLKIFNHCGHAIAVDAHRAYIEKINKFLK